MNLAVGYAVHLVSSCVLLLRVSGAVLWRDITKRAKCDAEDSRKERNLTGKAIILVAIFRRRTFWGRKSLIGHEPSGPVESIPEA